MIASMVGLAVALSVVVVLSEVLLGLVSHSTVEVVAADAARQVAGRIDPTHPVDRDALRPVEERAETRARALLGSLGRNARFDWSGSDADVVHLRLEVDSAAGHTTQTCDAVVRVERDR